jgi:SAM-dependent methyltransferase
VAPTFYPTCCAICGTSSNAKELYPERLDPGSFSPEVFSARRTPDLNHYRIVRCNTCGLVRSDPIADSDVVAALYTRSRQTYDDEIPNLKETYARYIAGLERYGVRKGAFLEIGCGGGFVLDVAVALGYGAVAGVEPSEDTVARSSPRVRPYIRCAMMKAGLFQETSFDVVCLFQVLDHIADVGGLLKECSRILKPGGLILALNHNARSYSARLLGERSPIIDVEHTFLYDMDTMARVFRKHDFVVRRVAAAWNTYSMAYLVRLLPAPHAVKRLLLKSLNLSGMARLRVSLPLGNLYLIAQKAGGQ